MKRFKYRINDGRELWICERCKKARAELILLGAWKLIDRTCDLSSTCGDCERAECAVASVAAIQQDTEVEAS